MNYIKIKNNMLNSSTCTYAYMDTKRNYADDIFVKYSIPVTFGNEYSKDSYKMVFVTFDKEYEKEFLTCMRELKERIFKAGNRGYDKICKEVIPTIGN